MSPLSERCTILVVQRERLSTTAQCLSQILTHTPDGFDLIVVLCGAPQKLRHDLEERFGTKVRFVFVDHYLNQAEVRNKALREAKTRLAAILDNDVYVRSGWLQPMIDLLNEKSATVVMPLVLEEPHLVHTAGNDLFITYKNGQPHAQKVLRCAKIVYFDSCNLKPSPVAYAELHCQLVQVEPMLRFGVFDEKLHEEVEIDSGLTLAKHGLTAWAEPRSVVHFDLPPRITNALDIHSFLYHWNTKKIVQSTVYFKEKWGLDIAGEATGRASAAFIPKRLVFYRDYSLAPFP